MLKKPHKYLTKCVLPLKWNKKQIPINSWTRISLYRTPTLKIFSKIVLFYKHIFKELMFAPPNTMCNTEKKKFNVI